MEEEEGEEESSLVAPDLTSRREEVPPWRERMNF